jgi:glycogen phosphorylase
MKTHRTTVAEPRSKAAAQPSRAPTQALLDQYECGPVALCGTADASYERHLTFDHVVGPEKSDPRQRFEAVAGALRDLLSQRWLKTDEAYDQANPKQVYYLSLEILIGRSLTNNVLNLRAEPAAREFIEREGLDWAELVEIKPDAGLGNGWLGRLVACFLDSMATLQLPAIGYGLRYEYGIFRQEIADGRQVEHPDHWLRHPDP